MDFPGLTMTLSFLFKQYHTPQRKGESIRVSFWNNPIYIQLKSKAR